MAAVDRVMLDTLAGEQPRKRHQRSRRSGKKSDRLTLGDLSPEKETSHQRPARKQRPKPKAQAKPISPEIPKALPLETAVPLMPSAMVMQTMQPFMMVPPSHGFGMYPPMDIHSELAMFPPRQYTPDEESDGLSASEVLTPSMHTNLSCSYMSTDPLSPINLPTRRRTLSPEPRVVVSEPLQGIFDLDDTDSIPPLAEPDDDDDDDDEDTIDSSRNSSVGQPSEDLERLERL
eukprot:Hpha_TRINITY_DN16869_c0_g2::TRINITY_DN16869_c0_g2_i1::g.153859::m.153859